MDGPDGAGGGHAQTMIDRLLARLHGRIAGQREGRVADYIPELGKADPGWFGISLTTADGQSYSCGDADLPFTIQSVSKPFTYGLALATHGREAVLAKVGVEPTGEAFNSIVLDEVNNRPFNPMVNSGAIAATALLPGADAAARTAGMVDWFSALAGRTLEIDAAVFASEAATGHRNRAIAYMMLNAGMIAGDPSEILDLYFRQCALRVTARDLSVMAATLANDGVQPVTGARLLSPGDVRDVLSVMASCGMYDYAGQWAFEVGMPAKSGVSGAIIAVIPGQLGLCAFSPPLDPYGNSIRGVEVCRQLSQELGLHLLSNRPAGQEVVRRVYSGAEVRSKRKRAPSDQAQLSHEGGRVRVVELQGALFFGAVERLVRQVSALPSEVAYLVLDFRRVLSADRASEALIAGLCREAAQRLDRLILAGLGDGLPERFVAELRALAAAPAVMVLDDVDAALEWCEQAVLTALPASLDRTRYALARLDLFAGLSADEQRLVEPLIRATSHAAGEVILREGDPARMLFIVVKGSVTVSLALPDGRRKRLAAIGPGLSFGEMALIEGGTRSADVIAEEPVICYALAREELVALGEAHPRILITIMRNLLVDFSERLAQANQEIRSLQ